MPPPETTAPGDEEAPEASLDDARTTPERSAREAREAIKPELRSSLMLLALLLISLSVACGVSCRARAKRVALPGFHQRFAPWTVSFGSPALRDLVAEIQLKVEEKVSKYLRKRPFICQSSYCLSRKLRIKWERPLAGPFL